MSATKTKQPKKIPKTQFTTFLQHLQSQGIYFPGLQMDAE